MDSNSDSSGADFSLSRRSVLGALGVAAVGGLAGCSDPRKQEFTAPIVGFTGDTFAHYQAGAKPVVLTDYEASSIVETRDGGDIGELQATLNLHATNYEWQLLEDYSGTGAFLSIPIPKVAGKEFPGQLDDSLQSLVEGKWGLELFNRLKFTDKSVNSVRYEDSGISDEEISNSQVGNDLFQRKIAAQIFTVRATLQGGEEELYDMVLNRFRTRTQALSDGVNDSFVFFGMGFTREVYEQFGSIPDYDPRNAADQFGVIPKPSL